jgi:mRNA-degrading endonuclease RelE of RelBE toxin-antitoxin system
MSYALRIDKQAAKTLKSLDQPTIKRLLARLNELTENPFDHRISSPLGDGTISAKIQGGQLAGVFRGR